MINPSKMEIRRLNTEDLGQTAILHKKAFPESALTKLGTEPVRRYYEWQMEGPHDCHAIGIFDNDTLVGFCFAGIFRGSLSGFLKKNRKFLMTWIIFRPWLLITPLITDRVKKAFHTIFQKKLNKPNNSPITDESYGILSIAVDPSKQGSGIGKLLMENIEKNASVKGFNKMHLTVHKTNTKAISFYESMGWTKIIGEPGIWMGSMTKILR